MANFSKTSLNLGGAYWDLVFDETKVFESSFLVSNDNIGGSYVFNNKTVPLVGGVPTYLSISYDIRYKAYQYDSYFSMGFTLFNQNIFNYWIGLSDGVKILKDNYGAFTVSNGLDASAINTNSGLSSNYSNGRLRLSSLNQAGATSSSTIQLQAGTTISLKAYQLNFS